MPFPVAIDPATLGSQPSAHQPFTDTVNGPIIFGGNLYVVLTPLGNTHQPVDVWKSTDSGATWATVDHAGAVSSAHMQTCFDGDHTITVAYQPNGNSTQPMSVVEFDLNTQTWGAPTGSGPNGVPILVLARPGGSKIIVFQSGHPLPSGDPGGLLYAVSFNGGFGAEFQFDTNIETAITPALYAGFQNVFGVVDTTGRTHVFVTAAADPPAPQLNRMFYQPITAGDTLGTMQEFAGVGTTLLGQGNGMGIPAIQGANLVFPVYELSGGGTVLSVFIGTPLAAPVFTLHSHVDGSAPVDTTFINRSPAALFDGTTLSLVYTLPTLDAVYVSGLVRVGLTTDFVTFVFTFSTFFDIEVDGNPAYQLGGAQNQQGVYYIPGGIGVSVDAIDPTDTTFQRFFLPPHSSSLSFSCSPSNGTVGVPYSSTCPATGGTPPYTYAITAGSLPPGLTLNPATDEISGVPTTPGRYPFTITVTDSAAGTASAAVVILISANAIYTTGGGPYVIPKPCVCDVRDLAAEAVLDQKRRKRDWPYAWSFAPPGAIRVTAQGTIPLPAFGALTQGLAYTVDQGYMFGLVALVVEALDAGVRVAWDPGAMLWTLDRNAPVTATSFQGSPVQGFTDVDVPLGSLRLPWPLCAPQIFNPNDTIRSKFDNISIASRGAQVKTILLGWRWPVR